MCIYTGKYVYWYLFGLDPAYGELCEKRYGLSAMRGSCRQDTYVHFAVRLISLCAHGIILFEILIILILCVLLVKGY